MAENNIKRFYTEPFTVRLTGQDKQFVDDHFEDLFDGDETIRCRQAFNMLVEKALLKTQKTRESQPEDVLQIGELSEALQEAQQKLSELSAQFNQTVELKEHFEKKYNEVVQQLEGLQANPQVKETIVEKSIPLEIDATTQRLLNLTPEESFVLAQVEHVHKTDATDILIKRFFNVYQERGNGDYNILRIAPTKLKEIKDHFKAQK
jgi:hypothetical protein